MYEFQKYRLEMVVEEEVTTDHDFHLKNSADIHLFLTEVCGIHKMTQEHFVVMAVNAKGVIIGCSTTGIGDLCSCQTHPREVFKWAVCCNAGSVALGHNHPSGDPAPSDADIETTKRLMEAGELIGIPVLDHVIVGDSGFVSLKAKGLV